jgi:hypothetical protein
MDTHEHECFSSLHPPRLWNHRLTQINADFSALCHAGSWPQTTEGTEKTERTEGVNLHQRIMPPSYTSPLCGEGDHEWSQRSVAERMVVGASAGADNVRHCDFLTATASSFPNPLRGGRLKYWNHRLTQIYTDFSALCRAGSWSQTTEGTEKTESTQGFISKRAQRINTIMRFARLPILNLPRSGRLKYWNHRLTQINTYFSALLRLPSAVVTPAGTATDRAKRINKIRRFARKAAHPLSVLSAFSVPSVVKIPPAAPSRTLKNLRKSALICGSLLLSAQHGH